MRIKGTPLLRTGTSAVWFSALGDMVPCKALAVDRKWTAVEVTPGHRCYKAGEILTRPTRDVVPVAAVRNSRQRLGGYYNVHYEIDRGPLELPNRDPVMIHHYVVSYTRTILGVYGAALLDMAQMSAERCGALVITRKGPRYRCGEQLSCAGKGVSDNLCVDDTADEASVDTAGEGRVGDFFCDGTFALNGPEP